MKTLSIRDLRQRWPAVEALLQVEREIIIARGSKPVAKLVCLTPTNKSRFDPVAHARWQRRINGATPSGWVDRALADSRRDRSLGRRRT